MKKQGMTVTLHCPNPTPIEETVLLYQRICQSMNRAATIEVIYNDGRPGQRINISADGYIDRQEE